MWMSSSWKDLIANKPFFHFFDRIFWEVSPVKVKVGIYLQTLLHSLS